MSQYKFQPNDILLQQYYANAPQSQETLVDFGVIPADSLDQEDWQAEVKRFITILASREYQFQPALPDGDPNFCPLYTVRLDKRDFLGSTPVDLPYFQRIVKQLCYLGQTTNIVSQILEIHVLGDGLSLEEILKPGK